MFTFLADDGQRVRPDHSKLETPLDQRHSKLETPLDQRRDPVEAGRAVVGTIAPQDPTSVIRHDETVAAAARLMKERDVGSLIVVNSRNDVIGILSERDIVRQLSTTSDAAARAHVADIMVSDIVSCHRETRIGEANRLMLSRHIRHLPIIEDNKILGMISSRDIMGYLLQVTRTMRASAEQIAHLIHCLKTLELEEVLKVIGEEVPKILQATRWAMRMEEYAEDGSSKPIIRWANCPCQEADSLDQDSGSECSSSGSVRYSPDVPPKCAELGCSGPRAVIRLGDVRSGNRKNASDPVGWTGLLCMCGLPVEAENRKEVLHYTGRLLRDILTATLSKAIQYEETRRRSLTDPLTGLETRRALDAKLAEEYERSSRYGRPFCVAVIDIDHFKAINDSKGHAGGDEILRRLGHILRGQTRACDVVVRYGGDEFVMLLPETALDGAVALLERLRAHVADNLEGPGGGPTISCGLAEWSREKEETAEKVLFRADSALYEAKAAGRNRTVVDEVPAGVRRSGP